MIAPLSVAIWRRGRGIKAWTFKYIGDSNEHWFSTPGWYRPSGRGRMYRLTIDHDYPEKPIWLGYKGKGRKWTNSESLYEVLHVTHPDFFIQNKRFRGSYQRSSHRRDLTAVYLATLGTSLIRKELDGR